MWIPQDLDEVCDNLFSKYIAERQLILRVVVERENSTTESTSIDTS